jgi:hypothetical protein
VGYWRKGGGNPYETLMKNVRRTRLASPRAKAQEKADDLDREAICWQADEGLLGEKEIPMTLRQGD